MVPRYPGKHAHATPGFLFELATLHGVGLIAAETVAFLAVVVVVVAAVVVVVAAVVVIVVVVAELGVSHKYMYSGSTTYKNPWSEMSQQLMSQQLNIFL